jgi:GNAT superfamily N-acetyltransferase
MSEPGLSMTFSGEKAVNYNVVVCHAPGSPVVERALAAVVDTGLPALIMLAGPALGAARVLADAHWVPVEAGPFMALALSPADLDPSVRRLGVDGSTELRSMVEKTYGLSPSIARLAFPDSAASDAPDADTAFAVWGLYEGDTMVSGVVTSAVDDTVCIWFMATPPELQRRGYGRRLLSGVLAQCARQGTKTCLLISSPAGEALYLSMGFSVVEYWQVWSRPRWVLA